MSCKTTNIVLSTCNHLKKKEKRKISVVKTREVQFGMVLRVQTSSVAEQVSTITTDN